MTRAKHNWKQLGYISTEGCVVVPLENIALITQLEAPVCLQRLCGSLQNRKTSYSRRWWHTPLIPEL